MTKIPTVPPFVNKTMAFILRSPVHGMVSKTILLFTYTGRKSGKTYTIPVGYSQSGGLVTIFTHHKWWKNLGEGAPVTLRIQGRELQATAEAVAEDKQAVAAGLSEHLRKVRSDAPFYEVSFDEQGNPNAGEVAKAAETVVMIRASIC